MPAGGIFVAVGNSDLGEKNRIGYSTDNGDTWSLVTTPNGFFGGVSKTSGGNSITYGNGRVVAVGKSNLGDTYNIGYSSDEGKTWTLSSNTNGLFGGVGGGGGYGNGIAYGNGRFVAVGVSANEPNRIGYSADGGDTWTLSTNTQRLFGGGGN